MAPQSPIRTSTEAPIPMGPLHIMSPAVRERAAHAGALHERPGPSFIPPETSLGGVASGLGGRAPSHTSRPSGRATAHPAGPGLDMTMTIRHPGRGPEPTLVETHRGDGPVALPHGTSRASTGPRARVETLLASASRHYGNWTTDSLIGRPEALSRGRVELSSARRDLQAAWRIIRNNPSLARDGDLMEEFRGLRSQVTRASDEMEHRDLVADLDRPLASLVV